MRSRNLSRRKKIRFLEKPENLIDSNESNHPPKTIDLVEQESVTRFDKRKGTSNNRKKKKKANNNPSETNIATKGQKTPNEPHNKEQENKQKNDNIIIDNKKKTSGE